jgi:hypothetical protein
MEHLQVVTKRDRLRAARFSSGAAAAFDVGALDKPREIFAGFALGKVILGSHGLTVRFAQF